MDKKAEKKETFGIDSSELNELARAIGVIKRLRQPVTGCPWDLEQTHRTLLPFLIEEAYEFIEAVERDRPEEMEEELGDVLLQVLLHTRIAEQEGRFTLESVAEKLSDKLIYRHPHVFKEYSDPMNTPAEVLAQWAKLKQAEREKKEIQKETMPSEYLRLPALQGAYKIGKKAREVAFDWDNARETMKKVDEEWQEMKAEWEAYERGEESRDKLREELGDLLFSVAQFLRHLKMNPEEVLREGNLKFYKRFHQMEELIKEEGLQLDQMTLSEKESYWQKAKKLC